MAKVLGQEGVGSEQKSQGLEAYLSRMALALHA